MKDEKNILDTEKKEKRRKRISRGMLNYIIDMGLAVSFLLVFITGLLKFPEIMSLFGIQQNELPMNKLSLIHDYAGLALGILVFAHLLLHRGWLKAMTKKIFRRVNKKKLAARSGAVVGGIVVILMLFQSSGVDISVFGPDNSVTIDGVGTFDYVPEEVETLRPELFQEGHFSVFDILVYLDNKGDINMDYHFDTSMNTYVIDEINGQDNWWYRAYYSGGWSEKNAFRMDHFPYKEQMSIRFINEDESRIQRIYDVFREEVLRKAANGGKIIIPTVIITGTKNQLTFNDVEVTPHNLRNDTFQNGIITAIDVIMSLGDEGKITYDLQWYSEIGRAEVKTYFVDRINDDESQGRCGFVYEEGSNEFRRFNGNHIHIPSDYRVLNSPEYMEWFWICI